MRIFRPVAWFLAGFFTVFILAYCMTMEKLPSPMSPTWQNVIVNWKSSPTAFWIWFGFAVLVGSCFAAIIGGRTPVSPAPRLNRRSF